MDEYGIIKVIRKYEWIDTMRNDGEGGEELCLIYEIYINNRLYTVCLEKEEVIQKLHKLTVKDIED